MGKKSSAFRIDTPNRLTVKVFLAALLCSSVFVGLLTMLQAWVGFQTEKAQINDNVKFIKKSYLPSIADSLYKMDEPQIRLLLKGLLQLKGVARCAVLYDMDGGETGIAEENSTGPANIFQEYPIHYPTHRGEKIYIGRLSVGARYQSYWHHFFHLRPLTLLINTFQIFATALLMLIIFQYLISRHLTAMAGYAQNLSPDNLEPVLTLNRQTSPDELEIVVEAINDLRERLKQDIEKRSRQEVQLKALNERFSKVMDSLDGTVYVADMETYDLLFINRYFRDQWGDVSGKTCWKTIQSGQSGPCEFCTNDRLLDRHGNPSGVYVWEFKNTLNNRWYECRDQAIQWTDGRIVRLEVAMDITDRKKAEEEKEKLQGQLQQSQKMHAIGTLAGGIAHDFNNMLSGILGFSHLVKHRANDPEKVIQNIDQVIKGAQKAADLVQQILAVSRQSADEKQLINIGPIVKEALNLLQASLPSTITIEHHIYSKNRILADPTRMHQIVMNLCTNAYHAMADKGGILAVSVREIELFDQGGIPEMNAPKGRYVKLEVSDTGHGMDPGTLEKIFDPYFTTKPVGKGTGLGLAIVAGVVEEHHGYLKVYSEPGHGATFHILFPLVENESDAKDVKEKKPPPEPGSETLMIVDDEEQIIVSLCDVLKEYGYTVCPFEDGLQAFEAYEKAPEKYDLIISDMTMPRMTGLELSQKILRLCPDQKIIISTGFSETINKEKAMAMGISNYIEKPIIVENFLNEIRSTLDG